MLRCFLMHATCNPAKNDVASSMQSTWQTGVGRTKMARKSVCVAMMVGLLVLTLRSVHAHDPKPVLRNIYGAPYAMLTAYEVRPGMEDAFLNTMVPTGPYNRVLAGFANERIIQPLASQPSAQWYISLGRYYDMSVARSVENERQAALSQLLLQPPLQLEATLVEHQLADWGWERGTTSSTLQAKPLDKEEVFEKNLSSLSFFK